MFTSINRPQIKFVPRELSGHPDLFPGIDLLRSESEALWIDEACLLKYNPVLQIPNIDPRKQPLRLVWMELKSINFALNFFSDEFKRNTVVLSGDQDIRENGDIAYELEKRGIALLMRGNLESALKSLHSLKIKSILVESGSDLFQ